jgi:hypothetical protein
MTLNKSTSVEKLNGGEAWKEKRGLIPEARSIFQARLTGDLGALHSGDLGGPGIAVFGIKSGRCYEGLGPP